MSTPTLSHREIWELIPWVVNGSAGAAERQALEQHLPHCADCREEYAFQHRLLASITAETGSAVESDAHAGLRQVLARIDADTTADATGSAPPRLREPRGFRLGSRALIAAVVIQAVGLALFAATLWQRERGAPHYQTLTSAPEHATAATIRLVPAPSMTLDQLQALLAAEKLRIVESNGSGSIYGLAPAADAPALATASAVERLRHQPGVLLAEPIVLPATHQ